MPIEHASFSKADEKRSFDNGEVEFIHIGDKTVSRSKFRPGWKWSNDIKPLVKTDSCQMLHTGVCLSGQLRVEHTDGSAVDLKAGDAYVIHPGHDAWVVGNEDWTAVDWAPRAGDFAKPAK